MTTPKTPFRYAPLDILRGIAIVAMIIVLNPGSPEQVFSQLQLSGWKGCTFADIIFPVFLFAMGVSLFFSFKQNGSTPNKASFRKIGKRTLYLFLLGVALNAFPFFTINWSELRIFGVLQRAALVYGLAACIALWLKTPPKLGLAIAVLILLHWAVLAIFGDYTIEGNVAGRIDAFLVGEHHLQPHLIAPFDSEGLLGVIPGAANVLFGFLAGWLANTIRNQKVVMQRLFTLGAIMLGAGLLADDILPINKPLWTGSFALLGAGWACLAFTACIYLSELKAAQKCLYPFKACGTNPLIIYIMASVFTYTLQHVRTISGMSLRNWLYDHVYAAILGDNVWASLAYAVIFAVCTCLFAIVLYRQRIFIKL